MRALDLIRHLRFRLQIEMSALPDCEVLQKTDMILGMYEVMVVHVGIADKEIGPHVDEAFERLFRTAREYAADAPDAVEPRIPNDLLLERSAAAPSRSREYGADMIRAAISTWVQERASWSRSLPTARSNLT